MGAIQDNTEQFFRDAELTRDDLDSVLAAVRHHFGATVDACTGRDRSARNA